MKGGKEKQKGGRTTEAPKEIKWHAIESTGFYSLHAFWATSFGQVS